MNLGVDWLLEYGSEVMLGERLYGGGITSAPVRSRAAELTAMSCDPSIDVILPPWAGETAVDILDIVDIVDLLDREARAC